MKQLFYHFTVIIFLSLICTNLPAQSNDGYGDRDADGVLDKDDVCPDVAGTKSNKGCPLNKGEPNIFALKEKGLITTSTNLKYKIVIQGSGSKPLITDKVTFHYKGTLEDGTVFDDSYKRDSPIEVLPSNMLKGMAEGLTLMQLGSKYIFYIPANLAYGDKAVGNIIKPNSNLIFEVELLKINDDEIKTVVKKDVKENINTTTDYKYYQKLASQNYKQKNYTQALENANKAIQLMPNDTLSLAVRGMSKEGLKDYKGAIEDYTTLITIAGNKANTFFFRRGGMYELEKDYKLALIDYEKMLALKPDFKLAIEGKERVKNILNSALNNRPAVRDPNRPFMQLIRTTTDEIKVCLKNWGEINKKMGSLTDQSISNRAYSDLLMQSVEERNKIYRIIKNRSKELEVFNDPTWPAFKAAYRSNLVSLGIEEKYLKDF